MRSLVVGIFGAAVTSLFVAPMFLTCAVLAQDQKTGVKVLTPQQCAQISKVSEGEYYIKGPVNIWGTTMGDITVQRSGIGMRDLLDAINRWCVEGRPN